MDPRLANIPRCAYRIIDNGHKEYLPLHYFDPDIRLQERRATLIPLGADAPAPRVRVTEENMSTGQYNSWSRQHIAAMEALYVPAEFVDSFKRHYAFVQSQVDVETAWTTWREYDLERRAEVVGDKPPGDFGRYSHAIYREIERRAAARLREQLEASYRPAPATTAAVLSAAAASVRVPRAPRAMLTSGASGSSAIAPTPASSAFEELKYACCFLCGSRVHQAGKDAQKHAKCSPLWLVWDSKRRIPAWVTPDTSKIVCWAWNSPRGCKKDACRLRGAGHRCAGCGDTSHTIHACPRATG